MKVAALTLAALLLAATAALARPLPTPDRVLELDELVPGEFHPLVVEVAGQHDLPPRLLGAVAWQESRWDAGAVGESGEVGLMQLLPSTAAWIADVLGLEQADWMEPETNLQMGAWYLAHLLEAAGGDVSEALARYNAGAAWRTRAPQDGARYARAVLARAAWGDA